jgi:hypothetical protein
MIANEIVEKLVALPAAVTRAAEMVPITTPGDWTIAHPIAARSKTLGQSGESGILSAICSFILAPLGIFRKTRGVGGLGPSGGIIFALD